MIPNKQNIIKRIDGGVSQAAVARLYGIGRSTVNEIYKVQRRKIEEFIETKSDDPVNLTRMKMRKAQ